ncbi:hypothetical protein SAMN05421639_10388 [Chryseobacterium shigense]|uniref:Uncharacterized protein n=1 Tax=Chryseobacterium shigense TaxID=297244 RepID=A0A1N7ICM2_9FLAO|nr:hypothetical protein SAMN05421639_10388 [Chryseobacterium shigense]
MAASIHFRKLTAQLICPALPDFAVQQDTSAGIGEDILVFK